MDVRKSLSLIGEKRGLIGERPGSVSGGSCGWQLQWHSGCRCAFPGVRPSLLIQLWLLHAYFDVRGGKGMRVAPRQLVVRGVLLLVICRLLHEKQA